MYNHGVLPRDVQDAGVSCFVPRAASIPCLKSSGWTACLCRIQLRCLSAEKVKIELSKPLASIQSSVVVTFGDHRMQSDVDCLNACRTVMPLLQNEYIEVMCGLDGIIKPNR